MAKPKKLNVSTYDIELTFICESCVLTTKVDAQSAFNDGVKCPICGKSSDMRICLDAQVTIN